MQANSSDNYKRTFHQRLDFYWQSVLIYTIVLVLYSSVRSMIMDHHISEIYRDPVAVLLLTFIGISLAVFILKSLEARKIIVSGDSLTFISMGRERRFDARDIERMIFSRERRLHLRESYRVVKIKIRNRRRRLRIRPHNFWDDMELYNALKALRQKAGA